MKPSDIPLGQRFQGPSTPDRCFAYLAAARQYVDTGDGIDMLAYDLFANLVNCAQKALHGVVSGRRRPGMRVDAGQGEVSLGTQVALTGQTLREAKGAFANRNRDLLDERLGAARTQAEAIFTALGCGWNSTRTNVN